MEVIMCAVLLVKSEAVRFLAVHGDPIMLCKVSQAENVCYPVRVIPHRERVVSQISLLRESDGAGVTV